MRTPVGSSNSVARSFARNSPGCEPIGVIFTFCAKLDDAAQAAASAMPAMVVFMVPSLVRLCTRRLNDGRPFRELGFDKGRQLLGCATGGRIDPGVFQPLEH